MSEADSEKGLSFEGAMERLENLVEQMESAQLPLAELINRYEEGNRLLQICSSQLAAAEERVQLVLKGRGGKPQVAAFDENNPSESSARRPEPTSRTSPSVRPESKTSSRVVDDSDEEISLF